MRLRRNRSYFIFCRTRPPEMVISSARTTTCSRPYLLSRPPTAVQGRQKGKHKSCRGRAGKGGRAHNLLSVQQLLCCYRRQTAQHVVGRIDNDRLQKMSTQTGVCLKLTSRQRASHQARQANRQNNAKQTLEPLLYALLWRGTEAGDQVPWQARSAHPRHDGQARPLRPWEVRSKHCLRNKQATGAAAQAMQGLP